MVTHTVTVMLEWTDKLLSVVHAGSGTIFDVDILY